MPHIIVEYSQGSVSDAAIPQLLQALHENLAAEESVDITRIKTRAIPVQHVVVADEGAKGSMVHVTLKIMPRPLDVMKRMAVNLQAIAKKAAGGKTKVTAEVVELSADTYCA